MAAQTKKPKTRGAKKKVKRRRRVRSLAQLAKISPGLQVRALDPETVILLKEFPMGSFPRLGPDAIQDCRHFRFSCDVYLRSIDYTTYHPSTGELSSESLELVGSSDPVIVEIPPA